MSIKSLPKKMGNDLKANVKAVYHALDIASDGSLSLIKESIVKSYQGFLDDKFSNLILDMANNNIKTDELINFINSKSHEDREFMSNLIIKSLHSDNRITTFLLSKLWENRIRKGSLNYYESSLFTNINVFTQLDYECFYELWKNKKPSTLGYFSFKLNDKQQFYIDVQIKLFSFGVLEKPNNHFSFAPETKPIRRLSQFDSTGMSEFLFDLLDMYFTAANSNKL